MKKFQVQLMRRIDLDVEAEDSAAAKKIADAIASKFPVDTCRVHSIVEEGHADVPCAACEEEKKDPKPRPHGPKPDPSGGSPQTPAVPVQTDLVDQIAEAA